MGKDDNFKIFYAISIAWQLGFLVALPIGGFMFLGWWGDRLWRTKPLFLFVGVVVGLVMTVTEVRHMLIPLIENNKHA